MAMAANRRRQYARQHMDGGPQVRRNKKPDSLPGTFALTGIMSALLCL
jgi:hypothetical protein